MIKYTLYKINSTAWYKVKFNGEWLCKHLVEGESIMLEALGEKISFDVDDEQSE